MGGARREVDDAPMTSTPAHSRLFIVTEPREMAPDSVPAAAERPVRRYRLARLRINQPPSPDQSSHAHLRRTYD